MRSPTLYLLEHPDPRLVKTYDIAFISTGDVLRGEIAAKSDIGRKVEEIVAAGGEWPSCLVDPDGAILTPGLVPDELMLELVQIELERNSGKVGEATLRADSRAGSSTASRARSTRGGCSASCWLTRWV